MGDVLLSLEGRKSESVFERLECAGSVILNRKNRFSSEIEEEIGLQDPT
jgi:hypothetical protein